MQFVEIRQGDENTFPGGCELHWVAGTGRNHWGGRGGKMRSRRGKFANRKKSGGAGTSVKGRIFGSADFGLLKQWRVAWGKRKSQADGKKHERKCKSSLSVESGVGGFHVQD